MPGYEGQRILQGTTSLAGFHFLESYGREKTTEVMGQRAIPLS